MSLSLSLFHLSLSHFIYLFIYLSIFIIMSLALLYSRRPASNFRGSPTHPFISSLPVHFWPPTFCCRFTVSLSLSLSRIPIVDARSKRDEVSEASVYNIANPDPEPGFSHFSLCSVARSLSFLLSFSSLFASPLCYSLFLSLFFVSCPLNCHSRHRSIAPVLSA